MEREIHEFIDLDEIAYARCLLNSSYDDDSVTIFFKDKYEITIYGDCAKFFFEQYTKHKKRKSIIHHCLITKVEK